MTEFWNRLTTRAKELATARPESAALLGFYAQLLSAQAKIHAQLAGSRSWTPSGVLSQDSAMLRSMLPTLLEVVAASGSPELAEEARRLSASAQSETDELLARYWREPSDVQFFAKALFQPYFRVLDEAGKRPVERGLEAAENRCPFCCGRPQLAYLASQEPSSESGNRLLVCAGCLRSWPFRRMLCAKCGEEQPAKLSYFHTAEYDYVRVDACDTCRSYLKCVDLTRFGLAVPLVDEAASAALDIWAVEHSYSKIELNLLGL
jgi:FdhE protein